MKNRQIKIEPFKMVCDSFSKGFDRGFVMKREVNILEATVKYIHTLQNIIFGITGVELNVDKLINKYYEN